MEACARLGKKFVVCDRPNPLGGTVEGAPQDPDHLSFVGLHPIPVRHGMTSGELARLLAAERGLDLDLVVSPVAGWGRDADCRAPGCRGFRRRRTFRRRRRPPSCIRGCASSRERTCPRVAARRGPSRFRRALARRRRARRALNAPASPGVASFPTRFRPVFDKHAGADVRGRDLAVRDAAAFRPFETGLRVDRDHPPPRAAGISGGAPSPTSSTPGRRSTC